MTSLLECRGLHKVFKRAGDDVVVLDDCDFALAEGERVAVMGASGAGKSTLLNLLSGLDAPSRGEILFRGRQLAGAKPAAWSRWRRDNVGFVFQFHFLLPDFTALENVLLPVRMAGPVTPEQERRAVDLLARMGLDDRLDHLPGELSGGEEQRVAVARAFINTPAVVLADEPTGNLDRNLGRELSDILFELSRENSAGLVIVTHSRELADRADRILRLGDGILRPVEHSAGV